MGYFYKKYQNLSKNEAILGENEAQIKQAKEQGRSMVEMLGVLAIIGVLSIGAISGYRYAMNKYRANQVVNELNLLSHQVAIAMMSKNGITELKLGEPYDTNNKLTSAGYEFAFGCGESGEETPCTNQTKFHFDVKKVSEGVCKELVQMSEHMQYIDSYPENCAEAGTALTFVYALEMSGESGLAETAPETGEPRHECDGTECCGNGVNGYGYCSCDAGFRGADCGQYCPPNLPVWDGENCVAASCAAGEKMNPENGMCFSEGCQRNADCGANEFCKSATYGDTTEFVVGRENGTCSSIGTPVEVSYNGTTLYLSPEELNWWSADRYCKALPGDKQLVQLADLDCADKSCAASLWSALSAKKSFSWWWFEDRAGARHLNLNCYGIGSGLGSGETSGAICK